MASLYFMGIIMLLAVSLGASQNCVGPLEEAQQVVFPGSKDVKDRHVAAVKQSINTFTTNFIKEIVNNRRESFICSPVSVWMALAMLSYGTRGQTELEFQQVLQLPKRADMAIGTQILVDNFNDYGGMDLHLAQRLFVPSITKLESSFTYLVSQTFRSQPQTLDFEQSECASNFINEWCENQTGGYIKEIIDSDDLSGDTSVVVVNAVYFKGTWDSKFDPKDTREGDFYGITKTSKMQFMYQNSYLYWGELRDLDATFVELSYQTEDTEKSMSMFITLPNPNSNLDDLEARLEEMPPSAFMDIADTADVELYLPKFTIESEFDLKSILQNMGLTEMFEDSADFSNMSGVDSKITKIVHKAFIEIDEWGSRATGASAGAGSNRSPPSKVVFKADRPFFVTIATTELGLDPVTIFSARFAGK